MYVFCAFRDMLALGCLTVTHFALGDRVGICASPAIGVVPRSGSAPALGASSKGNGAASPHCGVPTQTALLAHCAALGFFGVFANQLLFLKAREAVGLPLVRVYCLTCVQCFPPTFRAWRRRRLWWLPRSSQPCQSSPSFSLSLSAASA